LNAVRSGPGRWALVALPLAIFLALLALLLFRLGAGDPSRLPSALIGKAAPAVALPPLANVARDGAAVPGLEPKLFAGRVTIVNVWASWCAPCRDEHPFLMKLAGDRRLSLVGINYKDEAENARRFLERHGNPYGAIGVDSNGRGAIEWGVYGVPETFIVGRDGKIAYKQIGPIADEGTFRRFVAEIERALAG
jgi:cytochrome c biogenesis protein CcmG, thiol:disulfide interchange protein DsbE